MIEALKFVQGAVAKKDFIPALTHFLIKDGFIKGFNGSLSLSSPIDLDMEATPRAIPFVKAIETCKDTVAMSKTATGRLSIKSGKFKAFVECLEDGVFPDAQPEGEYIELTEGFIPALRSMTPFIGQDASRPWATGILFRGGSAFATNNIIIAEQWLGYNFPVEVNIPASTIKELLRIKQEPIAIQMGDNSITFHFKGDRWMRSQVYDSAWPDVASILNRENSQLPFPAGFFEALEDLAPFVEKEGDRIYFLDGAMTTNLDETQGAAVEVDGLVGGSCFQHKQLMNLRDKAKSIDFSMYPQPCIFYGDNFRGAMVGMRV